jgi:putative aminopeptidase FrvX
MRKESLRFLETLVNTPTPAGFETKGQQLWLDYVKQFADTVETDAYGNATATFNKGGSPRLMVVGHGDEIGLMVNYISSEGYLYFRSIGGVSPEILKAQRVNIHTASGPITGVIGSLPPHLTDKRGEAKVPKLQDLYIDIGAVSKKEALERVRIGDPVTLQGCFEQLTDNIMIARAFDNRAGSWIAAETIRLLSQSAKKCEPEVIATSTVMEEIGYKGAMQIAYSVKPDLALVVDVTHATDYPDVKQTAHGEIKLGGGPVLTRGTCNHPLLFERLDQVAQSEKMTVQYEASSRSTGTDTDAIFTMRGGIPSALVSIPNRYMHSPVEMIHLGDLEAIPHLFAAFANRLKKGETFKVIP